LYCSGRNNLKNGTSSTNIACMVKIAASALLKLFINDNKRCHAIDMAPLGHIIEEYTYTMM